jgi:hypothetical protein
MYYDSYVETPFHNTHNAKGNPIITTVLSLALSLLWMKVKIGARGLIMRSAQQPS